VSLPRTPFDVVVVGAGASGGWAAKELTEHGLEVALLDAGPRSPAEIEPHLRKPDRQRVQSLSNACTDETSHLFVDDVDNPYSVAEGKEYHWIRSRQVGGRLHVWGRTSPRMSDHELKAASRDGVGEDWPISYADLAPYYERVEAFLDVRGTPPPMVAAERRLKQAIEATWPTRRVTSTPWAHRDADATVEAAIRTGRLSLMPDTIARQVVVDATGERAQGVLAIERDTGRERQIDARVVVLCASALESTRLLLNSATATHPGGLANSSGALGHYLMDHAHGIQYEGGAPRRRVGEWEPRSTGGLIPGFRNVTEEGVDFLRSYEVELRVLTRKGRPNWWRRHTQDGFWMSAFGEVLPVRENRVSIDPDLKDAWGIPVLRIDCAYGENEQRMARDQVESLRAMLDAAGFDIETSQTTLSPPGISAHEMGTARMGDDPATSVLNSRNQAWDVPNLFVTDGACFTSSGNQNPTLTMMALTVRAGEFIVERLREGGI
jgi:choline dehydrogenase-like flavoprotein